MTRHRDLSMALHKRTTRSRKRGLSPLAVTQEPPFIRYLKALIAPDAVDLHFAGVVTRMEGEGADADLVVIFPDRAVADYVQERYRPAMSSAMTRMGLRTGSLIIRTADDEA